MSLTKRPLVSGAGRCCPVICDTSEDRQHSWRDPRAVELQQLLCHVAMSFNLVAACKSRQSTGTWDATVIPAAAISACLTSIQDLVHSATESLRPT